MRTSTLQPLFLGASFTSKAYPRRRTPPAGSNAYNSSRGFFFPSSFSSGCDDEEGRNLLEQLIFPHLWNDDDDEASTCCSFAKVGICSDDDNSIINTPEFYDLLQRAQEQSPKTFQESIATWREKEDLVFKNNCILASDLYRIDEPTSSPYASKLFASIFDTTIQSMAMHGYQTKLSRYDLFHGHLFQTSLTTHCLKSSVSSSASVSLRSPKKTTRDDLLVLGMLLHCYEYPKTTVETATTTANNRRDDDSDNGNDPQQEKEDTCTSSLSSSSSSMPIPLCGIDLGYCQIDSDCSPTLEEWRYRNVLWAAWCRSSSGGAGDDDDNGSSQDLFQQTKHTDPKQRQGSPSSGCGCWLLDGKSSKIANLRMDGTTEFGIDCPNTVWEGHFGKGKLLGDVYYLSSFELEDDGGEKKLYISSSTLTTSTL